MRNLAPEEERAADGRRARRRVGRARHGEWQPPPDRPDPLTVLAEQEKGRVPELLPIRRGRMVSSPFAFFRGAAAVMAADLAAEPRTGLDVQLCGDAHLVNFGGFASPERDLVFDLNDFDETLPGPFEWDVKRLAASLEVAGRQRGFGGRDRRSVVSAGVAAYRQALRDFAGMGTLDVWYAKLDLAALRARWGREAGPGTVRDLRRAAARAEGKNHLRAFNRLTEQVNGQVRFVSDPPLLVPVEELYSGDEASALRQSVVDAMRSYRSSLSNQHRHLFDRYRFVDLARKVVGVGSVGTRCWVALLTGKSDGDPLFIQVKEAVPSVLEPHLKKSRFSNHGQRVVEGQRLLQAAGDILLGWCRAAGADGTVRDFYLRQLWDWKISGNVELMDPKRLGLYAQICGWTMARAHARSGDATAISAYLGSGPSFERAIVSFASSYADQNARDHEALRRAVAAGRVEAADGV